MRPEAHRCASKHFYEPETDGLCSRGFTCFLTKQETWPYKPGPVFLRIFSYFSGIGIIEAPLFLGFILIYFIFPVHYLFCDIWIYWCRIVCVFFVSFIVCRSFLSCVTINIMLISFSFYALYLKANLFKEVFKNQFVLQNKSYFFIY